MTFPLDLPPIRSDVTPSPGNHAEDHNLLRNALVAVGLALAESNPEAAQAILDEALAAATTSAASATSAAASAALAELITGLTGEDAAVAALVNGVGGVGPLTRDALSASFGPIHIPLPASNGTDDTTALQAMLTTYAGKRIAGRPGSTYKLSAPLVISSGTTLDMTGCTVAYASSVATGSGFQMVKNAAALGSGARDSNIHIRGGYWDRATISGATGYERSTIMLHRVDHCSVTDFRFNQNSGSKFAVWFCDVTYASAERCDFVSMSDGVHVTGPASNITIRDITGSTDDDLVAFTGRDYVGYEPTSGGGNISNVLVERVTHSGSGTGNCVLLLPGLAKTLSNVTIRSISGDTGLSHVQLLEDPASPNDIGGTISDVVIDGVSGHPTSAYVVVSHSDVQNLTIRNVSIDSATTVRPISVELAAGAHADNITIDGVTSTVTTAKNIVTVTSGCSVDRMTVSNVDITQQTTPSASGSIVLATGTISELFMTNVRQVGGHSVVRPDTAGTIPLVSIANLHAGGAYGLYVLSPTAVEFMVDGVTALPINPLVYVAVDGASATLRGNRITGTPTTHFGGYTAARPIRGVGADVRVDCFRLTPVEGDIVTNTASSDVAGWYLGPVIYDGGTWVPVKGFAAAGDVTLNASGYADVGDARITATSRIRFHHKTPAGTQGALYLKSKTAASGFRVQSTSATDTSVVRWEVVRF